MAVKTAQSGLDINLRWAQGQVFNDKRRFRVSELERSGSIDYARSRAMHHHSIAHRCLDTLPNSNAVEILRELTDFQLIRIS